MECLVYFLLNACNVNIFPNQKPLVNIGFNNNVKAKSNKMSLERICSASIVSCEILHSLGIGKSVFT